MELSPLFHQAATSFLIASSLLVGAIHVHREQLVARHAVGHQGGQRHPPIAVPGIGQRARAGKLGHVEEIRPGLRPARREGLLAPGQRHAAHRRMIPVGMQLPGSALATMPGIAAQSSGCRRLACWIRSGGVAVTTSNGMLPLRAPRSPAPTGREARWRWRERSMPVCGFEALVEVGLQAVRHQTAGGGDDHLALAALRAEMIGRRRDEGKVAVAAKIVRRVDFMPALLFEFPRSTCARRREGLPAAASRRNAADDQQASTVSAVSIVATAARVGETL